MTATPSSPDLLFARVAVTLCSPEHGCVWTLRESGKAFCERCLGRAQELARLGFLATPGHDQAVLDQAAAAIAAHPVVCPTHPDSDCSTAVCSLRAHLDKQRTTDASIARSGGQT